MTRRKTMQNEFPGLVLEAILRSSLPELLKW
jgi:hypothetical protein